MNNLLTALAIGVAAWSVAIVLWAILSDVMATRLEMEKLLRSFFAVLAQTRRDRQKTERRPYRSNMAIELNLFDPGIIKVSQVKAFGER